MPGWGGMCGAGVVMFVVDKKTPKRLLQSQHRDQQFAPSGPPHQIGHSICNWKSWILPGVRLRRGENGQGCERGMQQPGSAPSHACVQSKIWGLYIHKNCSAPLVQVHGPCPLRGPTDCPAAVGRVRDWGGRQSRVSTFYIFAVDCGCSGEACQAGLRELVRWGGEGKLPPTLSTTPASPVSSLPHHAPASHPHTAV
jgi:hypothetical protein